MLFIGIVGRHYLQMDDEGRGERAEGGGGEGEQVVLDEKEKGKEREKDIGMNYSFDSLIEMHKPMGSEY